MPRDEVCPTCHNSGVVERLATPDEVDAGCELGIAFDPCPNEKWHNPCPYCAPRTPPSGALICTHCDGTGQVEAVTESDILWPDTTASGVPYVPCAACDGEGSPPLPLGYWAISGEAILAMLKRVANGEDPDLVYAEEYANSDRRAS